MPDDTAQRPVNEDRIAFACRAGSHADGVDTTNGQVEPCPGGDPSDSGNAYDQFAWDPCDCPCHAEEQRP